MSRCPPKSRRVCLFCCKVTSWKYERNIGHSRCLECGMGFSKRPEIKNGNKD